MGRMVLEWVQEKQPAKMNLKHVKIQTRMLLRTYLSQDAQVVVNLPDGRAWVAENNFS